MPTFQQLRTGYPAPHYPFSNTLLAFMANDNNFYSSLKLANSTRFQIIPVILTSHTVLPHPLSADQVIGIWYFDKVNFNTGNTPFFKQDFIINVGTRHTDYISYSAANSNGQSVKPIREFFRLYGSGTKFYNRNARHPQRWQHHYDNVINLPRSAELRAWAKKLRDEYRKTGNCTI
ncbi:MAG: hypothetical protein HYX20_00790 [Candidatus Yanofskybacteria bacterium]|nr:hypothetical protein [Candidatus Yanofskybacteria bacterium]